MLTLYYAHLVVGSRIYRRVRRLVEAFERGGARRHRRRRRTTGEQRTSSWQALRRPDQVVAPQEPERADSTRDGHPDSVCVRSSPDGDPVDWRKQEWPMGQVV